MGMYWFAKKRNGEIITLTELEALTHTESNNIASRMRLEFLGVSDGSFQKEAIKKINDMVAEKRPDDYYNLDKEGKAACNFNIRMKMKKESEAILKEAFDNELAQAKKNGFKAPRKDLHIHTPKGDRRRILGSMGGIM